MTSFDPWGPISSLLFEFSSDDVQKIVERAGLTPDWTLTKEQAYSHTTRKRAFRGRINNIYLKLDPPEKQQFIINAAKGILDVKPDHRDRINELLQNIGWIILEDRLVPIDVINPSDLVNLPQSTRDDLSKAAERLSNDLSGAITNSCGAVESVCVEVYRKHNLGEVEKASFQEKVNRSLEAVNALEKLRNELVNLGWDADKAEILCKNLKGAISQAAFVMQGIRSGMGDVHGSKPALNTIAFDSIKWSMIITSLLRE
jgi:hypothetical protein